MSFPIPVILFDGRLPQPLFTLAVVLGGNMLLKCIWGNIIEVKLIEKNEDMRMHPVVILFFVAFFGWIWGASGMLLSVPLMASLKACARMLPRSYGDLLLIFLEADKKAPTMHDRALRERAMT